MTANPQQIERVRKAVIMACHPKCKTYEGALEKELVFGCKVDFCYGPEKENVRGVINYGWNNYVDDINNPPLSFVMIEGGIGVNRRDIVQILGLPITLGRLMVALVSKDYRIEIEEHGDDELLMNIVCDIHHYGCVILKKNDDMLDQSEETIKKLDEVLNGS